MLMALLLAAGCTKERPTLEEPAEPSGVTPSYGTTYMSLSLRTGGGSSLAEDNNPDHNYISDWVGDDEITSFAVYVVSEDRDEVHYIGGKIANNEDVKSFSNNILTLTPWKTSKSKKTIYAFLNPPEVYVAYLGETLSKKADFDTRLKEPIPYQGREGRTYATGQQPQLGGFRPDPNIACKEIFKDDRGKLFVTERIKSQSDPMIGSKKIDTPFIYQRGKITDLRFHKWNDRIMTSGVYTGFTPKDNVSKEDVNNNQENLVHVATRRVLAQAVVTVDEGLLMEGSGKVVHDMALTSVHYQVLNFEPTFYPIAQTTDGKWFNNKNTETPSYKELKPSGLINFSTYSPSLPDEEFNPVSLSYDRFFRFAFFTNNTQIDPTAQNRMQVLFRQRKFDSQTGKVDEEKDRYGHDVKKFPFDTPTILGGGCYVTETTHQWSADEQSGYRKGNTPFFAVIASFDVTTLPWSEQSKNYASDMRTQQANQLKELREQLKVAEAERDEFAKQHPNSSNSGDPDHSLYMELENKVISIEEEIAQTERVQWDYVGDPYTWEMVRRGVNRIYYVLTEKKFYIDYHEIPLSQRRGKKHQLKMGQPWIADLMAKVKKPLTANNLEDGEKDLAILELNQDLLDKFSDVLNCDKKYAALSPAEQRSLDFYLYGRVSPKLIKYVGKGFFKGAESKSEEICDLRAGYVEQYTATNPDNVVNYEFAVMRTYNGVYELHKTSPLHGRLLMVYYAWVNPNTTNNRTWYSSPVLRNNIYHMHITGFTKMGLSGIPFVKTPTDPRFTYLHNIDPDEKVPSTDEYLPIQDPYMTVQVTNVGWGIHSYRNQF